MKKCRVCQLELPVESFHLHPRMRDGHHSICKQCVRDADRERYAILRNKNTPELLNEYDILRCSRCGQEKKRSEFYKNQLSSTGASSYCRECSKTASNYYNSTNRARVREVQVRYACANAERRNEYFRQRSRSGARKDADSKWYASLKRDPVRWAAYKLRQTQNRDRRRGMLLASAARYTIEEFSELVSRCFGRCLKCGARDRLTADHVVPVCLGGSNSISNMQILCLSCNASKGKRVIDYRPWTMDLDGIGIEGE